MKAELTRSDWIILRLVRESVRASSPRVLYEASRAVFDLVQRCGARTVNDAINQLRAEERPTKQEWVESGMAAWEARNERK
jgi:hypothetical protein